MLICLFNNIDSSENTDINDSDDDDSDQDKLYVPPNSSQSIYKRIFIKFKFVTNTVNMNLLFKFNCILDLDSYDKPFGGKQLCTSPLNYKNLDSDNIGN